jgi:ankyrin repeat domain-containing protein 50
VTVLKYIFIYFLAGTGKTYLTSKVIDDISDSLKNNPNHEGFAYFYCNRNETERQDPVMILRSFVRQLSTIATNDDCVQQRLLRYSIETRKRASEPTITDCEDLLLDFINLYPKTTLILDALDECDKEKRGALIQTLDFLLDHAKRPIKVFISSRPDVDIKEKFKTRVNIEIQATDNYGDISRFIQTEIAKHPRWKKMSANLQTEIIQILQNRSQGM